MYFVRINNNVFINTSNITTVTLSLVFVITSAKVCVALPHLNEAGV